MSILLAEDDPISCRMLHSMLRKWGYDVEVVDTGGKAWDALQREDAPELVILDWMMPGMDGVEVCRRVRGLKRERYPYILMLTAKGGRSDIVQGMEAGADDYIVKPFDSHELRARLRSGERILALQSQLMSAQESLRHRANSDHLTGLPNRSSFQQRLGELLAAGSAFRVMFIDLDRFKLINDTLGHDGGDEILRQVSHRLSSCLREADSIARLGGDEFVILLPDVRTDEDAARVAQRISSALHMPFDVGGRELFVCASIGISSYPSDGSDIDTLTRKADAAMYHVKKHGRDGFEIYRDSLIRASSVETELASSLAGALDRHEFVLEYQPLLDVRVGSIRGAEALIRWQHPRLGILPPGRFISAAEDTGLIVPIGEWVLRTACSKAREWHDMGFTDMTVGVNISPVQLRHQGIVGTIERALSDSRLDPQYLCLELTEGQLICNMDLANTILLQLRAMGIRISIDDFGTGYSSLSYLKHLPTDIVKLDRGFVETITTDPCDAAIAGAIIAMAHCLNLEVVAEGVETAGQLESLLSLSCDKVQGYLLGRPASADDFMRYLEQARR